MTKPFLFTCVPVAAFSVRQATAALSLVALMAPALMAQAQGLKPAGQLRLPTRPASSAISSGPDASVQRAADFIVAVVNSEPITNNEVRLRMVRAEQQLAQQGSPMPPRSELMRQVLERLISDKVQLQLARSSGLRIDDNAIENAVLGVARQNQISVDELRRRMVADGIVYTQFRSELRDELLVTRLRQREVEARINVTEQDVDQFLREQESTTDQASFELNLAQILLRVPENATAAQVTALQAKAQAAAERARSGSDFNLLVNEFPDTPERATGGVMGLRVADRYPPLFVEATQNLQTGGVAGPLRSGAGFHILKVLEKKATGSASLNITQTRARHILLRVTPQLTETAAVEKLAGMKKRILAGQADFATLARENSQDGSAREGGDLGWANPGMFVTEFEQVMDSLAPGRVSDPLVSRFGVHLIEVLERRETALSARDRRELARGTLREKKQDEAYALWAQDVRARAYVEFREPPQ